MTSISPTYLSVSSKPPEWTADVPAIQRFVRTLRTWKLAQWIGVAFLYVIACWVYVFVSFAFAGDSGKAHELLLIGYGVLTLPISLPTYLMPMPEDFIDLYRFLAPISNAVLILAIVVVLRIREDGREVR